MIRKKEEYYNRITKEMLEEEYKACQSAGIIAKKFNVGKEFIRCKLLEYNIRDKRNKYEYKNIFIEDSEQSFYWAGFLAADGNVELSGNLRLAISGKDIAHLYKYANSLKTNSPIKLIRSGNNTKIVLKECYQSDLYMVRLGSKELVKSLERFGIIPNKSLIYKIPENLLENNNIKHFIRGYFDGDGWFSLTKDKFPKLHFGICSGSLELINQIKYMINKLCNFDINSGSIKKNDNTYRIIYGDQFQVLQICKLLYDNSNIYLNRKYELSLNAKECYKLKIKNDKSLNLDKNILIDLYNELQCLTLVGKKLGCSAAIVRKYMIKYDIPRTASKQGERGAISRRINIDKNILENMYKNNISIKIMAENLNVCKWTIKKYLKEYNII